MKEPKLTYMEAKVFAALVGSDKPLGREALMDVVYGDDRNPPEAKIISCFISKIRMKWPDVKIHKVHGKFGGFYLDADTKARLSGASQAQAA